MDPRAKNVHVDERELFVELVDGRRIVVPLELFPRLVNASPAQRDRWRLIGEGRGIRWPDVDEDLSVAALLDSCRS